MTGREIPAPDGYRRWLEYLGLGYSGETIDLSFTACVRCGSLVDDIEQHDQFHAPATDAEQP